MSRCALASPPSFFFSTLILVLFTVVPRGELRGQIQHAIYLGYNYSEPKSVSSIPDGTSQKGILHVAQDLMGKSGGSLGYTLNFPLGELFYASSGIGLTWSQMGMVYSTRFYGRACSACSSFTQKERLGIDATYSNSYLRIPLSISIPFSFKKNTFLKVGLGLMWELNNRSNWNFMEVTWQFRQFDTLWTSQVQSIERSSESLPTERIQKEIFLSIWNRIRFREQVFLMEGTLNIGLDQITPFPQIKRLSYGLKVGYFLRRRE